LLSILFYTHCGPSALPLYVLTKDITGTDPNRKIVSDTTIWTNDFFEIELVQLRQENANWR